MLILAGVSLNAIIGDNGIITNAQMANYKNGVAILQEYLQEKYVENYDKFTNSSNKVAILRNIPECRAFFYNPSEDGFGSADFMTDSAGHALYLINKEFLPKEISDNLVGGNCGIGKSGSDRYVEFASLEDVYGVTSDLTIYYSSGDGTFDGIDINNLDNDTTSRIVLNETSSLGKLINSDGKGVTVADAQGIKTLKISNDEVADLSELYALSSLEELTLKNVNLNSLEGIQNAVHLQYIFFQSSTIKDYSSLSKLGNRLTHLYFYGVDDTELELICSSDKGIQKANFPNLTYFAVVGEMTYISSTSGNISGERTSTKYITSLEPISRLNNSCVSSIKYLNFQCNSISDKLDSNGNVEKYALEYINKMTNTIFLRIERNNITSLKGVDTFNNLKYVYATFNQLGKYEVYNPSIKVYDNDGNEREATDVDMGKNVENDSLVALDGKKFLSYLHLNGNPDLKWVKYLESCTSLSSLYFGDGTDTLNNCINMVDSDVAALRKIFSTCGSNKSYPSKYWLALLDHDVDDLEVDLSNQTVTESQFNSLSTYSNIKSLNLKNLNIVVSDTDSTLIQAKDRINSLVNNNLKYIKNLKYLEISSKSGASLYYLDEITFVKGADLTKSDDDILLIEIIAQGNYIGTSRDDGTGTNTFAVYDDGFKLFGTNRVDASLGTYGKKLRVLASDSNHVDVAYFKEAAKQILTSDSNSFFYGYNMRFININ